MMNKIKIMIYRSWISKYCEIQLMYLKGGSSMMNKKCFAEFIGTFFIVFVGNGAIIINVLSNNSIGNVGVSLAFGFIIFIMIFSCGDISGGN